MANGTMRQHKKHGELKSWDENGVLVQTSKLAGNDTPGNPRHEVPAEPGDP